MECRRGNTINALRPPGEAETPPLTLLLLSYFTPASFPRRETAQSQLCCSPLPCFLGRGKDRRMGPQRASWFFCTAETSSGSLRFTFPVFTRCSERVEDVGALMVIGPTWAGTLSDPSEEGLLAPPSCKRFNSADREALL